MNKRGLIKLILSLYFFILSIELIKTSALFLSKNLTLLLQNVSNPLNAFGSGWFLAALLQSSGSVATIAAAFISIGIISLTPSIYIIMGGTIGTTITSALVSFFVKAKRKKDFRHGFEIAISNGIYRIFYIIPLFLLEYLFHPFTKFGSFVALNLGDLTWLKPIPGLFNLITINIVDYLMRIPSKVIVLLIAILILFLSLEILSKSILQALGGEQKARNTLKKYFDNKWKSFFTGLILTGILFSSSITLSLLVPLVMLRLTNLYKILPFIIGANVGGNTDIVLAAIIIGKPIALSLSFTYILINLIGALIFINFTRQIWSTTKYISKHLLKISKAKALLYLLIFILIPLLLMLI